MGDRCRENVRFIRGEVGPRDFEGSQDVIRTSGPIIVNVVQVYLEKSTPRRSTLLFDFPFR